MRLWYCLLTTIVSVSWIECDLTTCKDGWLAFRGSCYFFKLDQVDFIEARHYCQQHQSHLIHVDDATENTFIKTRLKELFQHFHWWIGITDELVEGEWMWVDTDTAAEFTDFYPNDTYHTGEDCAVYYSGFGHYWDDYGCTAKARILCEMSSQGEGNLGIVG